MATMTEPHNKVSFCISKHYMVLQILGYQQTDLLSLEIHTQACWLMNASLNSKPKQTPKLT